MKKYCLLLIIAISWTSFSCNSLKTYSLQNYEMLIEKYNQVMIENYVNVDVAQGLKYKLDSLNASGHFDQFNEISDLVASIESVSQKYAKDNHIFVFDKYSEEAKQENTFNPIPETKLIDDNTVYLRLPAFISDEKEIKGFMKSLSNHKNVIIDLRDSRGGSPEVVKDISSYFFAERVHLNTLYWRKGNKYEEYWTEPTEDKSLINASIYIIVNGDTVSASEEFTYNLQTMQRAKIFGSKTRGAANPGQVYKIGKEISAFIPEGKAINPITESNWSQGIEPDIVCDDETALAVVLEYIKAQ